LRPAAWPASGSEMSRRSTFMRTTPLVNDWRSVAARWRAAADSSAVAS
jgi:hypothetical protein